MRFKWEHARDVSSNWKAINYCKVEKEYYDTVNGQRVKVTRYSSITPKESNSNPCYPATEMIGYSMMAGTGKVGK